MSNAELVIIILLIFMFVCEASLFVSIMIISAEIDALKVHMDFVKHDLYELRNKEGL